VHPIVTILSIGDHARPVGSYGLMLALAMVVGTFVTVRAGARAGMEPGNLIAVAGFGVGGSMAGSWLLFLAVEASRGVPIGQTIANGGGLVFYGAPVGGTLAMIGACRLLEVPFLRFADAAIPAIPIAHALGRVGCFFAGCCFGAPWEGPFAVRFTHPFAPGAHPDVLRHPTQLYEAFGLLTLALAFVLVPARSVGSGRRALGYVLAYAGLRFSVELFRGDSVRGLFLGGALSTSQLLSLLFAALAGALLLRQKNGSREAAPG
jgi:phosphatidylglycerol---prolipoprotein diacylglyceryl transferase